MNEGSPVIREKIGDQAIASRETTVKKEPGSDINILLRSLSYTVDPYSISFTKRNIEALLYTAKINTAPDRPAGTEKFFPTSSYSRRWESRSALLLAASSEHVSG